MILLDCSMSDLSRSTRAVVTIVATYILACVEIRAALWFRAFFSYRPSSESQPLPEKVP